MKEWDPSLAVLARQIAAEVIAEGGAQAYRSEIEQGKWDGDDHVIIAMRALMHANSQRVQIAANFTGGVLQGASANRPGVELYMLDYDRDATHNVEIEGEGTAELQQSTCIVDPDFVKRVIDSRDLTEEGEDASI